MVGQGASATENSLGPFHVHRGHDFEGFHIEERHGAVVLTARCACGTVLDMADGVFGSCPDCEGKRACARCGGTGLVVDHAALEWRLPDEGEERDANDS
jgi:hypothetical protein